MSTKKSQKKARIKLLKGHEVNIYEPQSIQELCKLSDGFLASRGNGDTNIRIWEITTGKCIQIIDTGIIVNNINNIKTMAHISSETSPNLIAFLQHVTNPLSSSNNEIRICNYITGEMIDQNPDATIRSRIPMDNSIIVIQEICGFNANIAFLVYSQSHLYYIFIWNTDIGDYVNTIQINGILEPNCLCSAGANLLAFIDFFGLRIYILNWENGVLRNIDTTFTHPSYYLKYIGNGKLLVAGREDNIKIINIDTSDILHSLDRSLFGSFSSICHLMNNYIALYSVDKINIWNVDTNKMVNTLTVDIKASNSPAMTYLGDNSIAIAGYIKEGRKKQEPVIQVIYKDNKYLDILFSQFVRGTGKPIVIPGKRKKNEPKVIPPLPADPLRIIYSFLKENPMVPKESPKKKSLLPIKASSPPKPQPYISEANYEKRTARLFEQLAKGEHPTQIAVKHATRPRSPYVSPVSEEKKVFIPDIVDIANANIDPKTQTRRKRKIYKKLKELQEAKEKLAKLYSRKLQKEKDILYRKIATKAGVKQLTQNKKKIIENAIEKASVSGKVDEDDLIEKLQDDLYTKLRKRAGLKTLHHTKRRLIDNALERASVSGEVDEDDLVRILKLPVDRIVPLPKARVKLPARKTATKKVNKSAKIPTKKLVLKRKPISQKSSTSSSPNIRKKPAKKLVLKRKPISQKSSTSSSPNTRKKSAYRKPSSDSSD
jgi:hypothetical protein